MSHDDELDNYQVLEAIQAPDLTAVEELRAVYPDFPTKLFSDVLLDAIDVSSEEVLIWLIENGADTNAIDAGYTPLHAAIENSGRATVRVLEKLIEHGADVNKQGISDWTPLHMAACRRHYRAIEILLRAGADPKLRTRIDNYATAAEEAQILGHEKGAQAIKWYIEHPRKG